VSSPYNKTPGLYFSSPTVCKSIGIVLLLLDQITVFNNCFHFQFDLAAVAPNLFNNFLALFTLSRRCIEVTFKGLNPISSFKVVGNDLSKLDGGQ
jgi:hypothetical protein